MTEIEGFSNNAAGAANSTLMLLHILAAALQEKAQLQDELNKTKVRVEALESVCQDNRLVQPKLPTDGLVPILANISRALQSRPEDAQLLYECQEKLTEARNVAKTLPGVLNGRKMHDAALEAAKSGNAQELKIFLDAGVDVDTADGEGRTLLTWTSSNGHVKATQLLLERNATVDHVSPGWYHNTPMMAAAWFGHLEVVKLLLDYGSVLEHRNSNDATELHHAAIQGRLPVVKLLVERGADIHTKMNDKTILQLSKANVAEWLRPRGTQLLLKTLSVVLNRKMNDAALEAAKSGNLQELKILLDAGVDVDTADGEGRSLLSWTSGNGHVQATHLLLERNATVDQVASGWYHNTPMMVAAWNGHLEVAKLLLEFGSVLEHRNDHDGTELHHAAMQGRLPVVKLLVEKGANIHAKKNNKTVLQVSKANVAEWLNTRVN